MEEYTRNRRKRHENYPNVFVVSQLLKLAVKYGSKEFREAKEKVPRKRKKPRKRSVFKAFDGSQAEPLGGDKRDRTADLLNAIQALSQLSYTPKAL